MSSRSSLPPDPRPRTHRQACSSQPFFSQGACCTYLCETEARALGKGALQSRREIQNDSINTIIVTILIITIITTIINAITTIITIIFTTVDTKNPA